MIYLENSNHSWTLPCRCPGSLRGDYIETPKTYTPYLSPGRHPRIQWVIMKFPKHTVHGLHLGDIQEGGIQWAITCLSPFWGWLYWDKPYRPWTSPERDIPGSQRGDYVGHINILSWNRPLLYPRSQRMIMWDSENIQCMDCTCECPMIQGWLYWDQNI